MKKSQVTSLVLLLLLVAVVNQAEAATKRERYRRTVRGTILKAGHPVANTPGSVECTGDASYKDGKGNNPVIDGYASGEFKTNSKGEFSIRLVFETNVDKEWNFVDLQGTCDYYVAGVEYGSYGYETKEIPPRTIDIA